MKPRVCSSVLQDLLLAWEVGCGAATVHIMYMYSIQILKGEGNIVTKGGRFPSLALCRKKPYVIYSIQYMYSSSVTLEGTCTCTCTLYSFSLPPPKTKTLLPSLSLSFYTLLLCLSHTRMHAQKHTHTHTHTHTLYNVYVLTQGL